MTDLSPSPRWHTLMLAVACEGGLAVIAWLLGWLLERPPLAQIRWSGEDALWGLAASVPLLIVLVIITHFPWRPLVELKEMVVDVLLPMFRESTWFDLALISLLAGVGEEMLFRGVLQEAIDQRFGPWIGLVAASLAFGLAHPITRTYVVLAGLIGAYLGGLWLMTGHNLLPPIIAHATYDFVAIVYLLAMNHRRHHAPRDESPHAEREDYDDSSRGS